VREVVGAILVLAGCVLGAAGLIADALTRGQGKYGDPAYVIGGIVVLVGVVLLFGDAIRRGWDAIPVDDKRPNSPGPQSPA
jgi:hypothetical protein